MITSVPPYVTFSLIKNDILHQSKIFRLAIVLSVLFRLVIALSVLFRLAIVLSVLFRFNASNYLFGIFMFFFDRPTLHRGVMVSVLASSAVDRVFKSKDSNICIFCFSDKHTALFKEKEKMLVDSESG